MKDRRYSRRFALEVAPIGEELEYGGVRVRTTATIAGARILIQQVDNGFGNAITPAPMDANTRFDEGSTMTLTAEDAGTAYLGRSRAGRAYPGPSRISPRHCATLPTAP